MEKHPVTPGAVVPAREMLGEMLLDMGKPQLALEAFQADLQIQPNRFNGLYEAGLASEQAGNKSLAKEYFRKLTEVADTKSCHRQELQKANSVVSR